MIATEQAPTIGESLVAILRKALPWLFYTGVHTFVVKSAEQEVDGGQSGGKLALEPSGTRLFKALPIVLQWSTGGTVVVPKVGSEVGIVFLDHDPNRPAIVAWQALALAGGRPDVVEVDADDAVRLGRHAAVTTVGDPASAEFVADASTVDDNFTSINAALSVISGKLNAAVGVVMSAPLTVPIVIISSTAVDKLKSE
jgi:hypothetical protein